jgi:putative pyruvate formate lyase activating enzyme
MPEIRNKIEKIEKALENLLPHETECRLCPRECGVNRKNGDTGYCGIKNTAFLSHAVIHPGEEPVISGYFDCSKEKTSSEKGSGTLFFSGCNLKCFFCQNYQISWHIQGKPVSSDTLTEMILSLQQKGAFNINLVSPSHQIIPVLRALKAAFKKGLSLPIVYNTNGYDKVEIIHELEDVVDIYLPDLKYFFPEISEKYSGTSDYFKWASPAIEEMYRQQPDLALDDGEIAQKGLIVRHLVLPGCAKDSISVLEWVAEHLSLSITISLMSQYYPAFKAPLDIRRSLSSKEYNEVLDRAKDLGFTNMFIQPDAFDKDEHLLPDFNKSNPFE